MLSDPKTLRNNDLTVPYSPPMDDLSAPSVARVYNYALGGKDHIEADRRVIDELDQRFRDIFRLAADNRHFLERGVDYLARHAGIRQFLDIGCGMPHAPTVREIAQRVAPDARVLYVDHDPVVAAHARALLADNVTTAVAQADAADPDAILDHPATRRFLDLDAPYAVLLAGVLHWLDDAQDPVGAAAGFRDRMPSGSYLLASNLLDDDDPRAKEIEHELTGRIGAGFFRSWEQHRRYFDGLALVDPGLVYANEWRTDARTSISSAWTTFLTGGIGMKR